MPFQFRCDRVHICIGRGLESHLQEGARASDAAEWTYIEDLRFLPLFDADGVA